MVAWSTTPGVSTAILAAIREGLAMISNKPASYARQQKPMWNMRIYMASLLTHGRFFGEEFYTGTDVVTASHEDKSVMCCIAYIS